MGDLLDARDKKERWYESRIVEKNGNQVKARPHLFEDRKAPSILKLPPPWVVCGCTTALLFFVFGSPATQVHFKGWADRWDEWINWVTEPQRLELLHTKVLLPEWVLFGEGLVG